MYGPTARIETGKPFLADSGLLVLSVSLKAQSWSNLDLFIIYRGLSRR